MTTPVKPKRVAVPVKLDDRVWTDAGRWESVYKADCNQCDWTYRAFPKIAVTEQARWHRQSHQGGTR